MYYPYTPEVLFRYYPYIPEILPVLSIYSGTLYTRGTYGTMPIFQGYLRYYAYIPRVLTVLCLYSKVTLSLYYHLCIDLPGTTHILSPFIP